MSVSKITENKIVGNFHLALYNLLQSIGEGQYAKESDKTTGVPEFCRELLKKWDEDRGNDWVINTLAVNWQHSNTY